MVRNGTARQATDGNIKQRIRIACWITKATDTHPEYVILIAFSQQQWLGKGASMLCYTHTGCPVNVTDNIHEKPLSRPYNATKSDD